MRMFVVLFMAVCVSPVFAQNKPEPVQAPPTEDVSQLKLQLAQKDLQIAEMNKTIVQLQVQLRLLERAALGLTGEDAVNTAQQSVDDAKRRLSVVQAQATHKKP